MSEFLNVSVSRVNNYLDEYEKAGYIFRKYINSKTVSYNILKRGIERRKVLNIQYLKASLLIYEGAGKNISVFLDGIIQKGFRKILLYGAGEVTEILLQVIVSDKTIPLEVLAVIDDDEYKIDNFLVNKRIIGVNSIGDFYCDGILVSSYTHNEIIYKKLIDLGYDSKKIIRFFN